MRPRARRRVAGIAAVFALATMVGGAAFGSGSAGDELSFEYSDDPAAVVLYLQLFGTGTDSATSYTLYGDGRLQCEKRVARQTRTSERQLEPRDVRGLLALAIEHGLADWDDTRIESEMAREQPGIDSIVTDAETTSLTIALVRFQRGARVTQDLRKRIRVTAPDLAAKAFPAIREFNGLVQVRVRLESLFAAGLGPES